jgi:hypothetical protein
LDMNTNQRRYTMHLYVTTLCFVSAGGGIAWILAESEKGARRLRSPTHPGPGINQSEMVHPSSGPDSSLENDTRCGRDRWHVQIPGARAPQCCCLRPATTACRCTVHVASASRLVSPPSPLQICPFVCLFVLASTRGQSGIHLLLPTQVTAGTHDWQGVPAPSLC